MNDFFLEKRHPSKHALVRGGIVIGKNSDKQLSFIHTHTEGQHRGVRTSQDTNVTCTIAPHASFADLTICLIRVPSVSMLELIEIIYNTCLSVFSIASLSRDKKVHLTLRGRVRRALI